MRQGGVSRFLVLGHIAAPETFSRATDVPVGKVVHKRFDCSGAFGDFVFVQSLVNVSDKAVQSRQNPLVHYGELLVFELMLRRIELVDVGVQHVKRIGVPECAHKLALRLRNVVRRESGRQPRSACGVEIPPYRVCALRVKHAERIDDVALMLAHFDAVFVVDVAKHYAVFKRALVEQQRGNCHKSVEPTSRLIDCLRNEVCRENLFKYVLIFKRIVPLRKRHTAAVVPAVHNFRRSLKSAAALATPGDRVEIRFMKFRRFFQPCQFAKLFSASDDVSFPALVAYPDRKRRTPISFSTEAPVDDVFQEVAETAVLDGRRHPVDGVVVFQKLISDGGHFDEPAASCKVNERSVASPAERIAVRKFGLFEQKSLFFQLSQNHFVGVLDEKSLEVAAAICRQAPSCVDELHKRQIIRSADLSVVLAERRRDMHHAGAVGGGNVFGVRNEKCLLPFLIEVEKRFVFDVFVVFAFSGVDDFVVLEQAVHKRFCENVVFSVRFDFDVVDFCVHAQSDVGRERPRRGRPSQKVGVFFALHLKFDEGGSVLNVLVTLRNLVARQSGAAARAIRNDLMSLVNEAFFVYFFKAPPDGLYVVVVVGDVRIVHIGPIADSVGHNFPFVLIFPNAFLALLNERFYAVFFYFRLTVDAEHFFHFQFNRQSVSIPPRFSQNVIALHCLVARNDVLHNARQDMSDMRFAVGRRRAVVKTEFGMSFVLFDAFLEDVVFFPKLQNLFFSFHEIEARVDFFIHNCSSVSAPLWGALLFS